VFCGALRSDTAIIKPLVLNWRHDLATVFVKLKPRGRLSLSDNEPATGFWALHAAFNRVSRANLYLASLEMVARHLNYPE
jgi:hypothetical protein